MDVLVVIDMQRDFIDGALPNDDAAAIVGPIVKEMLSGKYDRIILTQDTHNSKRYANSIEGKHLPIPHCVIYTEGHDLAKEILDVVNEKSLTVLSKETFGSMELLELCKDLVGIQRDIVKSVKPVNITLVGTCTDICVISNALILKTLPCEINVIADLCAGTSKENHEAALQVMRMCHINVL